MFNLFINEVLHPYEHSGLFVHTMKAINAYQSLRYDNALEACLITGGNFSYKHCFRYVSAVVP